MRLLPGSLDKWSTASLARAYGCDEETIAWYEADLEAQLSRLGSFEPLPLAA
jgi:hypothetical protein